MASPFVNESAPAPAAAPPPQAAPAPEPGYSPEPGKVAIKDPDGTVWKIDRANLPKAVQQEGAALATEAEYVGVETGKLGAVAAAVPAAARGLSFGYSDPALIEGVRAWGGDEEADGLRRALNLSKEAHPEAAITGEIAGAMAPLFFGGQGAGVAGAAELLGGGRVAKAVATTGGLAGEGAVIGLGQQASEDALGNHAFVGENYLTAAGKGSVIAVLLGGGLHAGGAGLQKLGGIYPRAEGALERLALAEDRAATRVATTEARAGERSGLLGKLEDWGDEAAFRGMTGAKTGDMRRLGKTVEAQKEAMQRGGRTLQDLAEREGLGVSASPDQYAKAVAKELKTTGAEIGSVRAQFDKAQARPDLTTIGTKWNAAMEERGIPAKLYAKEEMVPAAEFMTRMQEGKQGLRPNFKTLHGYQTELDAKLRTEYDRIAGQPAKPGAEGLRLLRSAVAEELDAAGARAAEQLGKPDLVSKHALLNEKYADLKTANKILSREVAQGKSRLPFGLSDIGFGTAAAAMTGSPAALLAPVASKLGREYGRQAAAAVIRKASRLESIQQAAADVDRALSRGASEYLEKKASKLADRTVTAAEVRSLNRELASPSAIEARVAKSVEEIGQVAPKVAAEASLMATRAAAHLRRVLPKEPPPRGIQLVPQEPEGFADSQLRDAAAAIEAIEDPPVLLERMKQGKLTQAHVDALREVHPQTYGRMQKWIRDHAADLRPQLTVQEEIELSLLFDQPLSETLNPVNVAAFQAVFAPSSVSLTSADAFRGEATGDKAAGKKMGGSPVDLSNKAASMSTGWDKLEAGT